MDREHGDVDRVEDGAARTAAVLLPSEWIKEGCGAPLDGVATARIALTLGGGVDGSWCSSTRGRGSLGGGENSEDFDVFWSEFETTHDYHRKWAGIDNSIPWVVKQADPWNLNELSPIQRIQTGPYHL